MLKPINLLREQEGGLESVNLHSGEVSVNAMTKDTPCGEYASPEFNFATMICASNNPAAATLGEFPKYYYFLFINSI